MKNYPLNPFTLKWENWTDTYLKEINAKVYALKRYSDFFLTDFIESKMDYSLLDTEELGTIQIIRLEILNFHNYARIAEECFLITDRHDANAIAVTEKQTQEVYYVRPISSGTTIISNARPEGSIDANGIQNFDLLIQDNPLYISEQSLPLPDTALFESLGFELPGYGPAHPDRVLWTNFIIQPTGFASLFVPEPTEDGLRFTFYEKGGEDYGTKIDIILFFQNARYAYVKHASNLQMNPQKWGLPLYAKSSIGEPQIVTKIKYNSESSGEEPTTQGGIVPWLASKNPLMCHLYRGRIRNTTTFGEEIVADQKWSIEKTKLANVNTLVYNVDIPESNAPIEGDLFEVDIL